MRDEHVSGGELFEELEGAPFEICESRVVIPKKGKLLAEDGSMKVAIIRPCLSRGKRIRGLPPIYEPAMLRESAGVFAGCPMYMDHVLAEALEEMAEELEDVSHDLFVALQERARSIRELGGRVLSSWWDDDLTFEDDDDFGYRPGGVVGKVMPQPEPLKMLEADPGILQCSINAYLTGARRGSPSWDNGKKGMLVEGLRRAPRPSVDWVFRGGAGGRPLLQESEEFRQAAVSVLEAAYTSGAAANPPKRKTKMRRDNKAKKLSEMSTEELVEHLKEEGLDELAEAAEGKKPEPAKPVAVERDGETVSTADVQRMIQESNSQLLEGIGERLEESSASVEERARALVEERETFRVRETVASKMVDKAEKNGLPSSLAQEIRGRYTLFPSGPSSALKVAEDDLTVQEDEKTVTKTPEQIVEARVRKDIDHSIKILREAGADPRVEGFGATEADPDGEGEAKESRREPNSFRDFALEEGLLKPDKEARDPRAAEDDAVRDLIREGVGV